jgi:hypothetical protein
MAQYEHLPIYKATFDLQIYFEGIVRHFSRYHKYTHGAALRNLTREALMLIVRANNTPNKLPALEELRIKLEELKVVIRICKEIKAFSNFNSFETSIQQVIGIAKQNEGWVRSVMARGGPRPESSTYAPAGLPR